MHPVNLRRFKKFNFAELEATFILPKIMSSVAESHVMTFIVSEAILVGIFGRFIKNKCKTSRMGSFDEVLHDVSSYSKQKQKTKINR